MRAGRLSAAEHAAVYVIANHRDHSGALLDLEVAAVELVNVIRPTVAVAWWIVFAALALHEHAEAVEVARSNEVGREWFAQEVRRSYPFFPFLAARVRDGFEWNGFRFPAGRRVLLDIYGIHRDPRSWREPERFLPERFRDWDGDPYRFIPQGGGDPAIGHRCPGDRVSVEVMKVALDLLLNEMRYRVPSQDLALDLARIPTLPSSGFVLADVSRTPSAKGPTRADATPVGQPA
ncbi:MAG: cytochrome P450 [Myxococcota bacterium]